MALPALLTETPRQKGVSVQTKAGRPHTCGWAGGRRGHNAHLLSVYARDPPSPAHTGTRAGRPSGVRKNIFPQFFFAQKWFLLGPGWISGPKKRIWTTLGPPNGAILAHFTHKVAKSGPKNSLKTRFFEKFFFCTDKHH